MITIPDKNSWSEHPNAEFQWMPVTREEDCGNIISQLHSVPKIINSPKSVAQGDKKFDAISDSHHHFLTPSPLASPIVSVKHRIVPCSLSSEYVFKFTLRYCHFMIYLDT